MIIEMRTYTVQPHKLKPWLGLWQAKAMPVQKELAEAQGGCFLGMYTVEVGALNDVSHLWQHRDIETRARVRAAVEADPRWREYLTAVEELAPMLAMRNTILRATPFSPQALAVAGGA